MEVDFFENFEKKTINTLAPDINLVIGGSGVPVLLLHGYPQSHLMWHKIAPMLSRQYTVIATDLRGYGDSGKPPGGMIILAIQSELLRRIKLKSCGSLDMRNFMLSVMIGVQE